MVFTIRNEYYEKFNKCLKPKNKSGNCVEVLFLKKNDTMFKIWIPLEKMIEMNEFLIKNSIHGEMNFLVYQSILRHNYINLLDYYIKNPNMLDHNWKRYSNYLLLYKACELSNICTIKFLLDNTSNSGIYKALEQICSFDKILPNGQLEITSNLCKNHIEIVKLLLKKLNDLSYNIDSSSCYNLFRSAIRSNEPKIIKLLIGHGLNINEHVNDLLKNAFTSKSMNVADFLFEIGGFMDIYFKDFKFYVMADCVESVKFIFDHYDIKQKWIDDVFVKFDDYSDGPILMKRNFVAMLQLFIDNGANIKEYGERICDEFQKSGKYELARHLRKNGIECM